MRRALTRAVPSVLLLTGLLCGFLLTPVPYVRSAPGGTYDALGKVAGRELIAIENSSAYPTYQTNGDLRILTVSELGGPIGAVMLGDAMRSVFDSSIVLQPTAFIYPDAVDRQAVSDRGELDFRSAASDAIAAALAELAIPVKTRLAVMDVTAGSPAEGKLKVGDLLLKLNGAKLADITTLRAALAKLRPGTEVSVEVQRNGKSRSYDLRLAKSKDGKPLIGVYLLTQFVGPMDIQVELDNVGGPSAGLAFAIAIYDKLTPGELLRGRTVAVTGTIDADGKVGAIGGLHQKLTAAARSGARLLIIPADNCADIAADVPPGLRVVPVGNLREAIAVLGSKPAAWPSCPAA